MCSVIFHNGKGLISKMVTSAFVIDTNKYCGLFLTTMNNPNIFFSMSKDRANVYVRDLCKNRSISIYECGPKYVFDNVTEAYSDEEINKTLGLYVGDNKEDFVTLE